MNTDKHGCDAIRKAGEIFGLFFICVHPCSSVVSLRSILSKGAYGQKRICADALHPLIKTLSALR